MLATLQQQTKCQKQALVDIDNFIVSDKQEYCLKGYAGVGKTTLIIDWIRDYLRRGTRRDLAICAPTNKATAVLNAKLAEANVDATALTIHSLLGIVPKINYVSGEEEFKPTNKPTAYMSLESGKKAYTCKILIIDEASMIGDELYEYIKEVLDFSPHTKIIYVGDPAQLPPVNEPDSFVFQYDGVTMTEIVRHGDEIAELATTIRDNLGEENPIEKCPVELGGTAKLYGNRAKWRKELLRYFQEFYECDRTDSVRAITWTNSMRRSINNDIRQVLIGKNAPQFVKGETLVAITPVTRKLKYGEKFYNETGEEAKGWDKIILANTEEVIVLEAYKEALTFIPFFKENQGSKRNHAYTFWHLDLSGKEDPIYVIDQQDKGRYKSHLSLFRKTALQTLDRDARKKAWKDYFTLKELNADVDYAYCLTAHKSQGSTFERVFVDARDISRNTKLEERNKCLYVAVSRASQEVHISL